MSRISTRTLALASSVAALSMTLSACSLLGGNTSAFKVEVGQCVQLPNGSTVSRVEVVECTAEHDGEVYHIEKLTDGERPSDSALNDRMTEVCTATFEGYVGAAYDDSDLEITTLFPTEASWKLGDRDIVCIAISNDGEKLSQSVKDSGM
jgi:putative membrane protein